LGLGINDILFPAFPLTPPSEKVSAEDIISGYRQGCSTPGLSKARTVGLERL
jgi:hypothetical protein